VLPLDKARVLQILVNLMNNARQAMDGVTEGARIMTLRVELAPARAVTHPSF
jgi:C4-dicarboxylate-specific signal transduction histidine kinase